MKQRLIILIVLAFVALVVGFVSWATRTPSPAVFTFEPGTASTTPVATSTASVSTPVATHTDKMPFKSAMTTYFYVGEPAEASNDFIRNDQSYWDEQWEEHFGGVDNPDKRCGFLPCGVIPKENPFYVALPYAEFDVEGKLKASAQTIPWYKPGSSAKGLLLKNHWVEIKHGTRTCFAQWEDVGPNNEDDFAYVFGSALKPTNTFGERAGLDVSPAVFACLGMTDNDITSWRFVDSTDIPAGPWKETVTSSGSTWAR